ncbi:hypothetical protein SUGI_1065180 [Cryptomeria japonica]|nr:hypothetical protein SUGI_1065180 [Cryptomeria japonica]
MEQSTPMALSDKGEIFQQPFAKFKPMKSFIKLNDTINNHNANATTGVPSISKFFDKERQFTSLNESLHSIMSHLLHINVIKLPPIKPIDPSKLSSPYFDNNSFCQFHRQFGHDTEKCFALKNKIQDLIENKNSSTMSLPINGGKGGHAEKIRIDCSKELKEDMVFWEEYAVITKFIGLN